MGAILTPTFVGLDQARDLPNAATLCNQCGVACPVKIPLPKLLRQLRERQFKEGLKAWQEMWILGVWRWLALRPQWYHRVLRTVAWGLQCVTGRRAYLRDFPFAGGWTAGRDLPLPARESFLVQYQKSRQQAPKFESVRNA